MRVKTRMLLSLSLLVPLAVSAACGAGGSGSSSTELALPTLQSPSLGYFLAPIIEQQRFDTKHGLDITFQPEPASTYRTNFASGTTEIGASGTLLTDVALLAQKGGDVQYLFNVFDFWGAVVSPTSAGVQKLSDLGGKSFAAALPTANYAMFKYIAAQRGLDVSKLSVQNAQTPALAPTAAAGKVAGVEMWEPAYTVLTHGNGDGKFHTVDLAKQWTAITGQRQIPYLGIAAHTSWITSHQSEIPKLYATYQDAAKFVTEHQEQAAKIIGNATEIDPNDVLTLLKSNRLGLHIYWASQQNSAIKTVLAAAKKSGYLHAVPTGIVYQHR